MAQRMASTKNQKMKLNLKRGKKKDFWILAFELAHIGAFLLFPLTENLFFFCWGVKGRFWLKLGSFRKSGRHQSPLIKLNLCVCAENLESFFPSLYPPHLFFYAIHFRCPRIPLNAVLSCPQFNCSPSPLPFYIPFNCICNPNFVTCPLIWKTNSKYIWPYEHEIRYLHFDTPPHLLHPSFLDCA